MKIIHLSDLHIGYGETGNMFKRIAEGLVKKNDPDKDIIVITGDLVDDANHEEHFEEAKAGLKILTKAKFQVLICPGNHDYGAGAQADKDLVRVFNQHFFNQKTVTYPRVKVITDKKTKKRVAFIALDSMVEELGFFDQWGAKENWARSRPINSPN